MSFEVQTKVQSRAHIPVTYAPKRPHKHAQEPLVKMNPIGPSTIMPNAYLQEKDTYPYSSALTNNHPQDIRPFPLGSTLPIIKRGKHAQTCSRHQPPAYQPNPTHSIFHHLNKTPTPPSSSILLLLHHHLVHNVRLRLQFTSPPLERRRDRYHSSNLEFQLNAL